MIKYRDPNDPVAAVWKISISKLFTVITRADTTLFIDNEDQDKVRDRIQTEFGHVVEGYYYFVEDATIEKIFAKHLLMRGSTERK